MEFFSSLYAKDASFALKRSLWKMHRRERGSSAPGHRKKSCIGSTLSLGLLGVGQLKIYGCL